MSINVYHLKNCDTCKKAIKAMQSAGHELTLIDVRADGVDLDNLARFADAVGFEVLLNTRSTTWRGLEDSEKGDVDLPKALRLMSEHPTLMKRPVIDNSNKITVGWTKQAQALYS